MIGNWYTKKAPAVLMSLAILTSTCLAQPANDNFANRIAITGTSALVAGSNVGATTEPLEPSHFVPSGGASVWWRWVAPTTTTVRLDTIGSSFDTVLAVYTGTVLSNLTLVARNAAGALVANGHQVSQVAFVATSGVEYSIAVDDLYGSTGSIVLNLLTGMPVITVPPRTQGVCAGSNVTFSVTAAGDPPLFYQWMKSGIIGGIHSFTNVITNATSPVLTLTNVQASDAMSYSVVVTNSIGGLTSGVAFLSLPVSEPYLFTTIAGKAGYSGSADGTGDVARFNNPDAVALDSTGNLYVAEYYNHTIRKVAPLGTNWVVTTLAGTAGVSGFVDGTNSGARFNCPNGVAVDGAGNVYVTERVNKAARKIAPQGTNWVVSTIATGFSGPGGCAVDTTGNVFMADTMGQIIRKIAKVGTNWVVTTVAGGSMGSADGTNSAAQFNLPDRVAVDAGGNLYVADNHNNTIRKITPFGTNWVVSTLAGQAGQPGAADGTNSTARFYWPEGVAADSAGSVYVGDYVNGTVRKITPDGVTTTLGGLAYAGGRADGAGSAARFENPNGVAVDSHGTVYVADSLNHTIRMGRPVIQMQPAPAAFSSQIQTQGFGCSISLASGLNYRIQGSSNLSDWSDLTNFTPAGLTYSFWDNEATNLSQRFYRVLSP
jgi:sugar lactone lactonase YvrE